MNSKNSSNTNSRSHWDDKAANADGQKLGAEFELAFNLELRAQLDKYSEDIDIVPGTTHKLNFSDLKVANEVKKEIKHTSVRLDKQLVAKNFGNRLDFLAIYESELKNLTEKFQVQLDSLYLLRPKPGKDIKALTMTDTHTVSELSLPCVVCAEATASLPPGRVMDKFCRALIALSYLRRLLAEFFPLLNPQELPENLPVYYIIGTDGQWEAGLKNLGDFNRLILSNTKIKRSLGLAQPSVTVAQLEAPRSDEQQNLAVPSATDLDSLNACPFIYFHVDYDSRKVSGGWSYRQIQNWINTSIDLKMVPVCTELTSLKERVVNLEGTVANQQNELDVVIEELKTYRLKDKSGNKKSRRINQPRSDSIDHDWPADPRHNSDKQNPHWESSSKHEIGNKRHKPG